VGTFAFDVAAECYAKFERLDREVKTLASEIGAVLEAIGPSKLPDMWPIGYQLVHPTMTSEELRRLCEDRGLVKP